MSYEASWAMSGIDLVNNGGTVFEICIVKYVLFCHLGIAL